MPSQTNSRFAIGDWVIHDYYGVGKIEKIVKKGLEADQKTFYEVSTKDIDYWLPMNGEKVDHVGPIRSKKDFEDALHILSEAPVPLEKPQNARKKQIHDRWLEGTLASRATLLRDLNGQLKLEKLNFNEKEMLNKVRNFFLDEWLIADDDLTPEQAKLRLRNALQKA